MPHDTSSLCVHRPAAAGLYCPPQPVAFAGNPVIPPSRLEGEQPGYGVDKCATPAKLPLAAGAITLPDIQHDNPTDQHTFISHVKGLFSDFLIFKMVRLNLQSIPLVAVMLTSSARVICQHVTANNVFAEIILIGSAFIQ